MTRSVDTASGAPRVTEPFRTAVAPLPLGLAGRVRAALASLTITDAVALVVVAGEWTGLARAALGVPIYAATLDVALLFMFVIVLTRAVRTGAWRSAGLLGALIAVYFGLAAVEILNPNVPSLRAGLEGFRKTAFTALAFGVVALSRGGQPGRFYRIVAVGSAPAFLVAIRQFFAPGPLDLQILNSSRISPITFHSADLLRAFSPTAGPFHLGVLSACVLVISLVAGRRGSSLWLLSAALAAVALGLTITRANLAAGFLAALVVCLVFPKPRTRRRNLVQAAPAAAAAGLAILFAIGTLSIPAAAGGSPAGPPSPGASIGPGTEPPTIGEVVGGVANPLTDKNLQYRFGYWAAFIGAFLERPIIGYGTGAAADGFDHFYEGTGRSNFEPHSLYFKVALEMGTAGLVVLLAILAYAFRAAVVRAWSGEEAGVFAVGILLVFAVSGLTGPMLDAYPANVLFWATCGWCLVNRPATASDAPSRQ